MVGVILTSKASETIIGGVSLFERQARMLRKAGINEILALDRERSVPRLEGEVLVLDGSCLIDDRILALLMHAGGEKIIVLPLDSLPANDQASAQAFHRKYVFAGGARLRGENLEAFLSGNLEMDEELLMDLSSVSTYRPEKRRKIPFLWIPVKGPQDNFRCKKALLNVAQKGVLDWPAWYIHRRIESWIVFHLCEVSITPNQVTLINNLVAFVAVFLFLQGHCRIALLVAMTAGILDGVDGKLARVKQMTSRIGEWEHHFDKVYENAWYLAIAYYLSVQGNLDSYILFGFIFAANMGDLLLARLFEEKFKWPLDDFGPFERRFRMIAGRRNTYIWALLPFFLIGQFYMGYLAITVYSLLSLSIRIWRYYLHATRPAVQTDAS